jgi:hypothetical protein
MYSVPLKSQLNVYKLITQDYFHLNQKFILLFSVVEVIAAIAITLGVILPTATAIYQQVGAPNVKVTSSHLANSTYHTTVGIELCNMDETDCIVVPF